MIKKVLAILLISVLLVCSIIVTIQRNTFKNDSEHCNLILLELANSESKRMEVVRNHVEQKTNCPENITLIQREKVYIHTHLIPSKHELDLFLKNSQVDKENFNNSFVCADFSDKLIKELLDEGYIACKATIYLGHTGAHELVAVETKNGILYVEPQSDEILTKTELLFRYINMRRVTSCLERYIPNNECVIISNVKKCHQKI